jgi:hypothetical protein
MRSRWSCWSSVSGRGVRAGRVLTLAPTLELESDARGSGDDVRDDGADVAESCPSDAVDDDGPALGVGADAGRPPRALDNPAGSMRARAAAIGARRTSGRSDNPIVVQMRVHP